MQRITSHLLSGLLLILSANTLHAQETAFMPKQHQQADSLFQSQPPTSVAEGQEITEKGSTRKRRHIQRIDREAMKSVFIPKGQWMVGGEISWNEWDNDNLNYLVLKNIEFEGHTFSAGPYFGYFVANNIAVGGRFSYKRFFMNLGQFDLNLGEDLNISLDDLYYLEHNYLSTAFMRSYMPIGRSNVFGFFAEVQLSYGYCEGKNTTGR